MDLEGDAIVVGNSTVTVGDSDIAQLLQYLIRRLVLRISLIYSLFS